MNSMNQTGQFDETTLIQRSAKGDLESFNQLVLMYQHKAYNHALALLGDSDLAEDITQDSFIKAFQSINQFRGASFRGWLLKIITNTAYDWLRRSHKHPSQPLTPIDENGEELESPAWLADPGASVHEVVEQKALSNDLYKILDGLPQVYRSVLTLIDIDELDYVEAAHVLKVPLGTVKSRLARARLQMKEKLQEHPGYSSNASSFAQVCAVC